MSYPPPLTAWLTPQDQQDQVLQGWYDCTSKKIIAHYPMFAMWSGLRTQFGLSGTIHHNRNMVRAAVGC